MALEFFGAPTDVTTSLTIKRMHRGMSINNAVVQWKGRVAGKTADEEQMEIVCQSIYATIKRMCLGPKYELICRHPLWSAAPQCRANQPAFRVDGTVTLITGGITLNVPVAGGYEDGWFKAGMIEYEGLLRTIVSHAGAVITLSKYMPGLIAGMTIVMYPGCNKIETICKDKFNNVINFGGFSRMSPKNPFDGLE